MVDLKELLTVSGLGGIHKFHAKTKSGLIVESLADGKKVQIFSTQKVSALDDISIFTLDEDVPLSQVFHNIYKKENGGAAISHKSNPNELKAYFAEVLPDFDEERVYVSDIKKVFQWYNLLHESGNLKLVETEEKTEEVKETKEEVTEKPKKEEKKPSAKKTKKSDKKDKE